MDRKEIVRKFEDLYFDAESLLALLESFMADRWEELEENPNDDLILEKMEQTKTALIDALYAQTEMNDREINEILSEMQTTHASEKKTLDNRGQGTGS